MSSRVVEEVEDKLSRSSWLASIPLLQQSIMYKQNTITFAAIVFLNVIAEIKIHC